MIELKRKENESRLHFIWRVYSYQRDVGGITNEECGKICRTELNESFDESAYRKTAQAFFSVFDEVKHEYLSDEAFENRLEEIEKREEELYKQQVKTRDKLREYRSVIRQESRIENLIDVIKQCAEDMDGFIIPKREIQLIGENKAILKVSDWHIGKIVDNYFNTYNMDVATARVNKLIEETIKYCNVFNVGILYVANLSDLIEGNLRVTSRVEAEENTIEQIMFVSELLSNMILDFKSYGLDVKYVSTLDNHSRSNVNYKEHIEIESFARLIDFYLKAKLGNKVEFINNTIDENIGHVEIDGKNHFFVHGHLKAHNPHVIIQNLAIPLGLRVDYVHMGHWHKSENKEYHFAKVYINGSLCGTDDHSFKNGWFSKASQRLLIVENNNEIDFNINLQ